eukprot:SAG11_NODE_1703_length_4420_cov_1.855589_1_plen_91_part_00
MAFVCNGSSRTVTSEDASGGWSALKRLARDLKAPPAQFPERALKLVAVTDSSMASVPEPAEPSVSHTRAQKLLHEFLGLHIRRRKNRVRT